MLSDEEKKELQELINLLYNGHISQYGKRKLEAYIKKQSKEIEELKEENEKYKNPPFFDEENYISKEESEQKEKQAYIDGTNAADKLCSKKWEDKIKAKIEEIDKRIYNLEITLRLSKDRNYVEFDPSFDLEQIDIEAIKTELKEQKTRKEELQSLLEKE